MSVVPSEGKLKVKVGTVSRFKKARVANVPRAHWVCTVGCTRSIIVATAEFREWQVGYTIDCGGIMMTDFSVTCFWPLSLVNES